MKTIQLSIFFLLFTLPVIGQSLTGLWTGALSNDSATVRKDQSFEIALTQYKDKVYGFSRSTFIVNDTLYYIIKRVKGTIEGNICEVEDDNVVSHNFPKKPEKGVKVISTFRRDPVDSTWSMDGEWKTNKTKKYYSISGKMALKEEKNYEQSKIFPHLEELGIAKEVSFYQEAINTPQSISADRNTLSEISPATTPVIAKNNVALPDVKSEGIAKGKTEFSEYIVAEKKQEPVTPIEEKKSQTPAQKTVAANSTPKNINQQSGNPNENKQPIIAQADVPVKKESPQTVNTKKTEQQKPEQANAKPPTQNQPVTAGPIVKTKDEVAVNNVQPKKELPAIVPTIGNPTYPNQTEMVAKVAERKMAPSQTFTFKSDSLLLSLYDNGEVDGDTVSVLINGQVILAKQGLKASAIRKTVYVPAGSGDSLHLVLYAENLGRFPPNTGLLIVHDGDDVYQIRFSADLSQNASVIFRRRKL